MPARTVPQAKSKLEELESAVAFNPEALAGSGVLVAAEEIEALTAKLEEVSSWGYLTVTTGFSSLPHPTSPCATPSYLSLVLARPSLLANRPWPILPTCSLACSQPGARPIPSQ